MNSFCKYALQDVQAASEKHLFMRGASAYFGYWHLGRYILIQALEGLDKICA
jgi:hypothetical protein